MIVAPVRRWRSAHHTEGAGRVADPGPEHPRVCLTQAKEIAIFGELLAISAIVMCMLFVLVDVGRRDRVWHLMPLLGSLNLPSSIPGWDVLVLNLFLFPATRKNLVTLNLGCLLIYTGVYIEKGMALIIPGMTPDTLGEFYEYVPTMTEVRIGAGIFATGFLVSTVLCKIAIPILQEAEPTHPVHEAALEAAAG